jgi:RNA polymerase sigma-70 factor, ECF subfamily
LTAAANNSDRSAGPPPGGWTQASDRVLFAQLHQRAQDRRAQDQRAEAGATQSGTSKSDDSQSERAFAELVRRYRPKLVRLAVQMVRDTALADDVVQETFVRIVSAVDKFDGRSEPYTWMYRICVNLSLNAIRGRRVRMRVSAVEDAPDQGQNIADTGQIGASPEQTSVLRQRGAALNAAIDALSESLRTTVLMVAVEGISHEESAAILGVPEGTIAWRIHEARKRIREALERDGWSIHE